VTWPATPLPSPSPSASAGSADSATELGRLLGVPAAIVLALAVAVVVNWVLRRLIGRLTAGLLRTSLTTRLVTVRSGRTTGTDGEPAPSAVARVEPRARTTAALLKSVTSFVVLATAAVVVLALLGLNVAPLIASAGIIGIAVGFGAQSLVRDFLTGLFLVFEDQFAVGDTVDTGFVVGTVDNVGLRVTRLHDSDGTVWYVPNGSIERIGNRSKGWGTATVDVPIGFGTDIDQALRVLRDAAEGFVDEPEWVDQVLDEPPVVAAESTTATSVTLRVIVQTVPGRQLEVSRALRARLLSAADREQVSPLVPVHASADGTAGSPTGPSASGPR